MGEKTSEAIGTTHDVVIQCSHDHLPEKAIDCQDQSSSNNHDAGYLTSDSNYSLHTEVLDDGQPKFSEEETRQIFEEVRTAVDEVPQEQRWKWLVNRLTEYYGSVMPASLIELTASHFFHGDSGIGVDVRPDWLDIKKFQRGQKLATDHLFGLSYADLLSLFAVFSFEDGLKPLIFTNASSTPYTAFKRYLSTFSRVHNWYTSDPWTPGTPAYNDICEVRRMHAAVRKKIEKMPHDEYDEKTRIKDAWCPALIPTRCDLVSSCDAPKPGQCPYVTVASFPELKEHKLSQGEMAATQFSFVGLFVLYPTFFGLHYATDEDLEAYCHVWQGLGYLLGVDDQFNFCRGTLEDVRTRSKDILEYWVKPNFRMVTPEWEHMIRCVIEGMQYYFPGSAYEICLLDLAEIMNLHMPHTYESMSYLLWIRHKIMRFYFDHASKFAGLRARMNNLLNAAVEKAKNFDKQKHEELKARSAETLDSYIAESKRNEISFEESSMFDWEMEYV